MSNFKLTFAALVVLTFASFGSQAEAANNTISQRVGTTTTVVRKATTLHNVQTSKKNEAQTPATKPIKIKGFASTAAFVNFALGFNN